MVRNPAGENTEKRTQIADAALKIIGTKGIAELTMVNLAQELGVSPGAPFRHFKSRDEILMEVGRRVAELVGATFPDPALPPLERLKGLFLARTEVLGKESGLARLIFSDQFAKALPPEAAAQIHRIVKQTRTYLLQILKDAAAAGLVRRDIPAEDLLVPVIGTLQHLGFLTAVTADRTGFPRPEAARVLTTLLALLSPVPT